MSEEETIQNWLNAMELARKIEHDNEKNEEIERLQDMDKILRNENINLKLRINKAIKYIESYLPNYDFDKTNLIKLLEILDVEGK